MNKLNVRPVLKYMIDYPILKEMRLLLTILINVSTLPVLAQGDQSIKLSWQIGKNEKLQYSTILHDIDTSSIEVNLGDLFNTLSDSTKSGLKYGKDLLNKLNEAFMSQNFVTTLSRRRDDIIDIVMTTIPNEKSSDTEYGKIFSQGVVLRGSVFKTGGIHSFWVKSDQKNLLAILFELPERHVKVGDKWSIEAYLVANDENFECDSSYRINDVLLADIKKVNGETIAVLKYNIQEYVKGDFHTPAQFGNKGKKIETMMKLSHQAIAEFSVDRGRWINYDGIMSLESSGVLNANKKTKVALVNTNK